MVLTSVFLAIVASVSAFSVPLLWDPVVNPLTQPNLKVERDTEQLDKAFAHLQSRSETIAQLDLTTHESNLEVFESNKLKQRLRYTSPSALGIDSTKQISGYFDYGQNYTDHLFFWFFESRNKPSEDPVVLWLNGGPGCSSLSSLFFELGPSSIDENLHPKFNENSWNSNASIIFVDQPVNVGLSYSEKGTGPTDSVSAMRDVYALLELFFQNFPEYAQNDFHIAGESYAGHYIPALGVEIRSHKDRSFNLSSLIIGNGWTDPVNQYAWLADMACGKGGYTPVLDSENCTQMEMDTPQCVSLIEKCYANQTAWSCVPATKYCNNKLYLPYFLSGWNLYDVRKRCENRICYEDEEFSSRYLNQEFVQQALGVSPHRSFSKCNEQVYIEFFQSGDWMRPYNLNITTLLNENIPVLVYAGDADFSVNWMGCERWTNALNWTQSEAYKAQPLKPWLLNGEEVGQVRSLGPLTFAKVYGGGHMLPHDQPESSLDLLNRWIKGGKVLQ